MAEELGGVSITRAIQIAKDYGLKPPAPAATKAPAALHPTQPQPAAPSTRASGSGAAQLHDVQPKKASAALPRPTVVNVLPFPWKEPEGTQPRNQYRPPTHARAVQAPSKAHPTALLTAHSHAKVVAEPTHHHDAGPHPGQQPRRTVQVSSPAHPTKLAGPHSGQTIAPPRPGVLVSKPTTKGIFTQTKVQVTETLSKEDALDLLNPFTKADLRSRIEGKLVDKIVALVQDAAHVPELVSQAISLVSAATEGTILDAAQNYEAKFGLQPVEKGAAVHTIVVYTVTTDIRTGYQIVSLQARFLQTGTR